MLRSPMVWIGAVAAGVQLVSVTLPGCGNSIETVPYVGPGGSLPTGGAGGAAEGGAAPGGQEPSRGDPADFPAVCLESCQEACARLSECDGAGSELYPVDEAMCAERCSLQEDGYYWDDQSANFKCCTSQTECADVKHCGGWLAHDTVAGSCDKLCECFMSGAIAALTAPFSPPEGYRFATDRVMVEVDPGAAREARGRVEAIHGVRVAGQGARVLVELTSDAPPDVLALLSAEGRILPTLLDPRGRLVAVTGTVILSVREPSALAAATALAASQGLGTPRASALRIVGHDAAAIYLLEGRDGWRALDGVATLDAIAGLGAELDMLRSYRFAYQPDDPRFDEQWHLRNTGQNGAAVGVDGRVSEAWDRTLGDPEIIIALNDDGVDLNHPDLADHLEPALNYPDDWQLQMSQGGFGWHGTSCAGVAAAIADNTEGGAGVCPDCHLLPHLLAPSDGQGFQATDTEIAAGFERLVDAGAAVISNSWGYETGDPVFDAPSTPMPPLPSVIRAAFDYAETTGRGGLGTVVVFAAGNSNDVIDPITAYETNVCVAAVTDLGLKSYYSSFGPEVDIAAPSNGGLGGITTTAASGGYTDQFGGTSSACPFVAGVAGLVLSANPDLSAAEVRAVLAASATKLDPVFGQWDGDGHSPFYGAGLVNAFVAVELASGDCADAADCPAPSDDCAAGCGSVEACGGCRTGADCAAGFVCQPLPSLGTALCVAEKGAEPCPAGTVEREGYCLPEPATCGLCGGAEQCNGRDDDCSGSVDDGDVCGGYTMCFFDGPGCGAGQQCAGIACTDECSVDADCGEQGSCEPLKDSYGAVPGPKGCVQSGAGMCQLGCEALASSLPDDELAGFVDCMQDGAVACSTVYGCASYLPISM